MSPCPQQPARPLPDRPDVRELEQAIDTNDLGGIKDLMTRSPDLHRAPLGYGENGPLTWVAECRVPWEPPAPRGSPSRGG